MKKESSSSRSGRPKKSVSSEPSLHLKLVLLVGSILHGPLDSDTTHEEAWGMARTLLDDALSGDTTRVDQAYQKFLEWTS